MLDQLAYVPRQILHHLPWLQCMARGILLLVVTQGFAALTLGYRYVAPLGLGGEAPIWIRAIRLPVIITRSLVTGDRRLGDR